MFLFSMPEALVAVVFYFMDKVPALITVLLTKHFLGVIWIHGTDIRWLLKTCYASMIYK